MFFAEAFGEDAVTQTLRGMRVDVAIGLYGKRNIIIGHFQFTPEIGLPSNWITATVLRDPRERILSDYYYQIEDVPNTGAGPDVRHVKKLSLEEYLFDQSLLQRTTNPQAKHYAALLYPNPGVLSDEELLDTATRALERYDLVGITERLDEFTEFLKNTFSLPDCCTLKRHNVTSRRKGFADLPKEIQQRIEEISRVDMGLWSEANRLYDRKIATFTHAIQNIQQQRASPVILETQAEMIGDGSVQMLDVSVNSFARNSKNLIAGELAVLHVRFRTQVDLSDLTIGYSIYHDSSLHLFESSSRQCGQKLKCSTSGIYFVDFIFPVFLGVGSYYINLSAHSGHSHLERCYLWQERVTTFSVTGYLGAPFEGIIRLMPTMTFGATGNDGKIEAVDVRTREEIFIRLGMNTPEVFDARGSLVMLAEINSVNCRLQFTLGVEISNHSKQVWRGEGNQPVRLSYHWLDERGKIVEYNGRRSPLPGGDIRPGQTVRADAVVEAPDRAGNHVLVITLVQEGVCWFENRGFQPARMTLNILDDPA